MTSTNYPLSPFGRVGVLIASMVNLTNLGGNAANDFHEHSSDKAFNLSKGGF